jgi:hypothetical protein
MTIANATSKLLLAVLLASPAVPASALEPSARVPQQGSPKIMMPIPTPTPVASIKGCWAADENLYGYRLSFCVHPSGSANYTVTGNGLYCHARLGWQETWGSYGFTMSRTSCGHGTDWSADTFTCVLRADWSSGPMGKMPIPGQGNRLDCNYRPSVWGYRPTSFSAHRA